MAEDALQNALRRGDVDTLDSLLDAAVVFVGPDGSESTKDEDLLAHRTGALRLDEITELARSTRQLGDTGITRVALRVRGLANGEALSADLIYTRTWRFDDDAWRVIQAHCSVRSAA